MKTSHPSVLIVADSHEMADADPIWGTGGWLPPEERRALDWFTLCRLMGLRVSLTTREEFNPEEIEPNLKWLIVACDPDAVDEQLVIKLKATLARNLIAVICQISKEGTALAKWLESHSTDETIRAQVISTPDWPGGESLRCRNPVQVQGFHAGPESSVVAFIDEFPLISATRSGKGRIMLTGFDPGEMRDREGVFSQLLQRLLIFSSSEPVAWIDWHGTLVLRMDDPGSSEALYNQVYGEAKIGAGDWGLIGHELAKRSGRLSVGYVSGWVDAGEAVPGTLRINSKTIARQAGEVHPSPTVQFAFAGDEGAIFYDHVEEFNALQELRNAGLVEVELHGYTHVTPDRERWMNAPDRFESNSWFREFGPEAVRFIEGNPALGHPLDKALDLFERFFGSAPTTLICPGEEFTDHVLVKALEKDLMLVSSYYLGMRVHGRLCWTQHVCAPYLDAPDPMWFDSCLPVVGYFHDFDVTRNGVSWFAECLDEWQHAGARRFIDLSELNAVINTRFEMVKEDSGWELELRTDARFPLPRALELNLFFPEGTVPSMVTSRTNQTTKTLDVTDLGEGVGSIVIGVS